MFNLSKTLFSKDEERTCVMHVSKCKKNTFRERWKQSQKWKLLMKLFGFRSLCWVMLHARVPFLFVLCGNAGDALTIWMHMLASLSKLVSRVRILSESAITLLLFPLFPPSLFFFYLENVRVFQGDRYS